MDDWRGIVILDDLRESHPQFGHDLIEMLKVSCRDIDHEIPFAGRLRDIDDVLVRLEKGEEDLLPFLCQVVEREIDEGIDRIAKDGRIEHGMEKPDDLLLPHLVEAVEDTVSLDARLLADLGDGQARVLVQSFQNFLVLLIQFGRFAVLD